MPQPEMPAIPPGDITLPPAPTGAPPWAGLRAWHRPVFVVFLACWCLNVALLCLRIELTHEWRWLEGLLLLAGVASTLLTLGKRLPVGHVLLATLVILALASVVMSIATVSGIPFGARVYGDALGWRVGGVVPWAVPLLWVLVLINGRAMARLILRPWRKTTYYGLWVIALAAALAAATELNLDPFAVHLRNYWAWQSPWWVPSWYGAPWVNFLGGFAVAAGILLFSNPWLINRQPVKLGADYQPVITWALINLYFIVGNATRGLWGAVLAGLFLSALAVTQAVRGARW